MSKAKSKRIPNIKPGTPVIVHWFDAHEDSSKFGGHKDLVDTNCELLDIGFWIGAKGRFVTIAVEKDLRDGDYYRHTHHFPKVNIIEIKVLDEPTYSSGVNGEIQPTTESGSGAGDGVQRRKRRGDSSGDGADKV